MRHIRRLKEDDIPHSPIAEKEVFIVRDAFSNQIMTDDCGRQLYMVGREAVDKAFSYAEQFGIDIRVRNPEADARHLAEEKTKQAEFDWLHTSFVPKEKARRIRRINQ